MSMIVSICLWILIGTGTSYLAYKRGRDPYIWLAIGIFFGILATLVLLLLPPLKSEEEIETDQKNVALIERRESQMEEQDKLETAPDLQPQSIETKDWFYLDKAHQQQGPLSFFVINELWEGGDINAQSFVWTDGMVDWKKIEETPDLFHVLEHLETENRKAFPEDL